MSDNKQSSIQWIVGKLGDLESMFNLGIIDNIQYYEEKTKLVEQAKAMHKEEIINFTDNYVDNCVIPNENMAIPTIMDVPQYYNETFGGNNE